ncbi:putative protein phosphatase 2C 18 [Platanthera zijinensis]|uniref:Uncharacterized protein n=1 Tax=Platanthera zijinensis TaxID=2320716 RepID=A0AAP0B3I9_9ASPA
MVMFFPVGLSRNFRDLGCLRPAVLEEVAGRSSSKIKASAPFALAKKNAGCAINRTDATKLLVRRAIRTWRTRYPTSKNDDCVVICIFLKHPLLSTPPSIDGARHPPKPRQRSHSESFETVRSGESSETEALGVNKDDWAALEGINREERKREEEEEGGGDQATSGAPVVRFVIRGQRCEGKAAAVLPHG